MILTDDMLVLLCKKTGKKVYFCVVDIKFAEMRKICSQRMFGMKLVSFLFSQFHREFPQQMFTIILFKFVKIY